MMRRVLGAGLAMLAAGCDQTSLPLNTQELEGRVRGPRNGGEEVRVWKDPATGCQYLVWQARRRGSMTPRLGEDGRPICRSS